MRPILPNMALADTISHFYPLSPVYTIQPVVKPVVNPVLTTAWQLVVSYKRGIKINTKSLPQIPRLCNYKPVAGIGPYFTLSNKVLQVLWN